VYRSANEYRDDDRVVFDVGDGQRVQPAQVIKDDSDEEENKGGKMKKYKKKKIKKKLQQQQKNSQEVQLSLLQYILY